MKYRALVCGVNRTAGASPLRFAEDDARRVHEAFTGPMGPASASDSPLLLGPHATVGNVLFCLQHMARIGTEYLLFYFSGHGGEDGIALADGTLSYRRLHKALQEVSARAVLVILDACQSGTFGKVVEVGGIGRSWAELLESAMPGMRMFFAARSDENTMEGGGVPGGRFTWTFLEALRGCAGAMRHGNTQFVADDEAFYTTYALMAQRWPQDALPEGRNLKGDFPMLQSQVAQSTSPTFALIVQSNQSKFALDAVATVLGYNGRIAEIRYQLLDEGWHLIARHALVFWPRQPLDISVHELGIPNLVLPNAIAHAFQTKPSVILRWAAQLVDPLDGALLAAATTFWPYSLPRAVWTP
ncbi:caspase family protein [Polyangium sp. 15x6]|uniref:caspase family protein n=1 Tax=Polyangium sp. 15x6 TaxID=3042687 RepID=UPI00249C9D7F|nr:caspase family protein [Polyangium sp. 15x6]MDI3288660.1 caspase family protein [Polyangium sp. 15x6]